MPKIDLTIKEWISVFGRAIKQKNVPDIRYLIHNIPQSTSKEQLELALLKTMEAEEVLIELRQRTVREKEKLMELVSEK